MKRGHDLGHAPFDSRSLSRLRRRRLPSLLGLQHLLPIVHHLGGISKRGQVAPHPILPRGADHLWTELVELLFELRRIGLGVLENLEDVHPSLVSSSGLRCPTSRPNAVPTTTGSSSGGLTLVNGPNN